MLRNLVFPLVVLVLTVCSQHTEKRVSNPAEYAAIRKHSHNRYQISEIRHRIFVTMSSHRKAGNELYNLVVHPSSDGKHALWKRSKLEESLKLFNAGRRDSTISNDISEWLKCTRASGVVYARIASDASVRGNIDAHQTILNFVYAFSAFCATISNGSSEPFEWRQQIVDKIAISVDLAAQYARGKNSTLGRNAAVSSRKG